MLLLFQLCKNRQDNDLYIERGMQTFNDLPKHEHIITDPVLTRVCIDQMIEHILHLIFVRFQSQKSWANTWDMYNSAIEANQYEGKSNTFR